MPNGNSVKERITALEVKVAEIADNHLTHIAADIKELKDSHVWFVRFMLGALVGILIDIGLKFLR